MEFNLDIARQLVQSNNPFPVDFDDAWKWLEYSRKDNAKTNFFRCGFIEGTDYTLLEVKERVQGHQGGGAVIKQQLFLSVECFKQWGMMCGNQKGKQIRLYFLECEKLAKSLITTSNTVELISALNNLTTLVTQQQQQLNSLTERTHKLDILEQEYRQVSTEKDTLENTLNRFVEAGEKHNGCYNIIENEVNKRKASFFTAYDFLLDKGYDVGFAIKLAKRTATFYRCSLKEEPFKNSENIMVFEERYLEEAYQSLKEE